MALPGLDPAWSRLLSVADAAGAKHTWHVLDNGVRNPTGTLLCVHGNPTWSYLWRRLLAAPPPGWRVVAPDQLGMGWSERLPAPRSLQQRVADLGDLTAAMGISGPVVTVGHDWGGVISLGWALRHRKDLRSVILANTAVALPDGDRGPVLIRLVHAPGVRAAVTVGTPAFVRATTALSRPALPADVRRAFAAPYRSAARRRSVGDFVADIPFSADHPSRAVQEAIAEGTSTLDVPALLLWGPRDPVFGERYLADLRGRLPQARLHRFEGASHLLPEDAPEYAAAIARWVGDLGSAEVAPDRVAGMPGSSPVRRLWSALEERSDDDAPAVVEVGGATVSWRELARRVADLAAGLAASGVRPGDRVALLVEPSADLTASVYALWRAGAVAVVADKGLGLAAMRRALRSAAVDHVVASRTGLAAAHLMGLPGSRFAAGRGERSSLRVLRAAKALDQVEALGRAAPLPAECPADADCAVLFTSGATGPAKGVVYTHRQAAAQLEIVRSAYALTADDRFVAAFAPFAILGPALGIGSAVPDVDVTAPGSLTAAALAEAAAAVDATVVFASPAALRRVAATVEDLSAPQRTALAGIRLLMSAGAPVPASLLWSLRAVLPAADAHTPYGMTEVLPVTDISLAGIEAAGGGEGVCVGRPQPGVGVRISPLSPDGQSDGELTDRPGVPGEVCVRAAHVKDRYDALWALEVTTSRDPGWHRTGDVGHLDADGRLWIEGRLQHVITTAAGPVTPVGIEQRVETLAQVSAAAAVGVGPAGAQVVVVVVVVDAASGDRAGGRLHGRSRLPRLPGPLQLADLGLVDAVRAAAGADVAAVVVAPRLPVDVRHQSKVDRGDVARRAARLLAGARTSRP
jgi:acyl-coenzyme A synthetase/AMP-(fatty) acid ligase/pimeloyl-ACP methyl ester carboxylesterase